MINFREVNDSDILKDWLDFREDTISSLDSEQDMKHWIYFEEIADKILKSIPKQNRKFVEKQLEQLDDNFFDYITSEPVITPCITFFALRLRRVIHTHISWSFFSNHAAVRWTSASSCAKKADMIL